MYGGFLRQSTASQSRVIGPFVDDTDFKTAETGLTIANTDIKLRANGTTLSNKNSGGGTHQANGMYSVTWDATDTANVGELAYSVVVSGALQVFGTYVVLEEIVYDALFAASALGYVDGATVNTTKVGGTTQTARDLGASVLLSSGTGTGQVKLSAGYVAPNWGDVGNPTTTVGLSGTTVKAVTDAVLLSSGTGTGQISLTAGRVALNSGIKKNTALANFTFLMTDSTNHNPVTGLTVSATRRLDNGAYAACANTVSEVSNGTYAIDLAAADMNGSVVDLRFTATGADDLNITIVPDP